jgi:ketosteroid isomerase-like protein
MSQENVEVVREVNDLWRRRDMEAAEVLMQKHLAPNFEFESVMTGQVHKGAQGMRDLAADLWETVDYVPSPEEIIDLGDEVVVVLRISGRGVRSGVAVSQQVAILYTFEGNRIVRAKSFTSRAEALEAAGLSE